MTADYLFAAVHRGPYLTLAPIERALGRGRCAFVVEQTAAAQRRSEGLPYLTPGRARAGADWRTALRRRKPRAVVLGISKTPEARNLETELAAAASAEGVPVYVVEDYPGNYVASRSRPTGVFVEFDSCRALHRKRGVPTTAVHVVGNPRYASLPQAPSSARLRARRTTWALGERPLVLWAGQPDGALCAKTLRALWPAFEAVGAGVVLRRHPLDRSDLYDFRGSVPFVDASAEPDPLEAAAAVDLVVTQFSTLAVEAGYYGTPSLFVLLPGLGADYLRRMTDDAGRPPWSAEGCAFELRRPADAVSMLRRALFDAAARRGVLSKFHRLRDQNRRSAVRIADIIRAAPKRPS